MAKRMSRGKNFFISGVLDLDCEDGIVIEVKDVGIKYLIDCLAEFNGLEVSISVKTNHEIVPKKIKETNSLSISGILNLDGDEGIEIEIEDDGVHTVKELLDKFNGVTTSITVTFGEEVME